MSKLVPKIILEGSRLTSLQAAGLEASGVAEGPNRAGGDLHLVASATLDAVENLLPDKMKAIVITGKIFTQHFGRAVR